MVTGALASQPHHEWMNQPQFLEVASLVSKASYVSALREELPDKAFEPAHSRLWLLPLYAGIAVVAILAIARGWVPWFVYPLLSLVIGVAFACLTFIAHEAGHGGIVRGHLARRLVSFLGFLPFTLSPRLWAGWHDRVHHAHANDGADPDMYPTLEEYRASKKIRFVVDSFSMGGKRWRGGLSLVLGFTVQSANQLFAARRCGFLKPRAWLLALGESLIGVAIWATVAVLVGGVGFIFVYVLPLLVANFVVMSFILTNHGLSPRVEMNDPLVSGLSVTAPRWVEWMTLQFGYHVEHHLFPAMSSRHARDVRALLRVKWPTRYQSLPIGTALRELHRTARIYKNATTLVDPRTGREFATLMPHA